MKRLRISAHARADLIDIRTYGVEQWGAAQAETYRRMVRDRLLLLRQWPHAGALAEEVIPGLRRLACGSHVIYYLEREDYLLIARILHHAMDYRQRLSELG